MVWAEDTTMVARAKEKKTQTGYVHAWVLLGTNSTGISKLVYGQDDIRPCLSVLQV